jgi:SAM-dependent methyltransferase
MSDEQEYVLGTHDEELRRLGLQHLVWRPRALDAWRRAGLSVGQRVLDYGSGPGFATIDIAEIVGASGEVIAVERSRRFLTHLQKVAHDRGLEHIRVMEIDLATDSLDLAPVDAAWCRWIFAFLPDPQAALQRLLERIRPGGVIVIHEYLDYST